MSLEHIRVGVVMCALTAGLLSMGSDAWGSHSATDRVSVGQINGNGSQAAGFSGATADGTRAFFTTTEQLVSADTDSTDDVYERSGGTTTLISTGPSGGNAEVDASFSGMSADGSRVFFTTAESLVGADVDGGCLDLDLAIRPCEDIYERSGGTTTLVSAGGNGAFDAQFEDSSDDGSSVFFTTAESLVAGDTDAGCTDPPDPGTRPCRDLYQRSGGSTTLVSTGGNGMFDAYFGGASADGTRVFFSTAESLIGSDTDSFEDVYQRSSGTTTLLSTGPAGGNGAFDTFYGGSSSDGARVFLETSERLVSGDTDSYLDVYERSSGTTTLLSTGPAGGNGAFDAGVAALSSDGSRVFVASYEQLAGGDTDGSLDLYERAGGTTSLRSTGPSGGNGAFDVFYRGLTPDGAHLYFTTAEKLVSGDTDSSQDVYDAAGGTTTQVSVGQINGNGAYTAAFRGASDDGQRVFFTTREKLVSADSDPAAGSCVGSTCSQDIYERFGGTTYLISLGPMGDTGNKNANYGVASADGLRVFYTTAKQQLSSDTDTAQDVYQASVPGSYVRPKGAAPVRVSLVPAQKACTAPTLTHGPPLAYGSCPPVAASSFLTVGTPDSGSGGAANSVGSVRLSVLGGNPSTPPDEADVRIRASITDVRCQVPAATSCPSANSGTSGADYGGQLELRLTLRITDKYSGSFPSDPATATDYDFSVTTSCVQTAGVTTVGSTCSVDTTADALVPGALPEGKRTVWQLDQVRVYDGGADGLAATAPNTLYMVQGVFVP